MDFLVVQFHFTIYQKIIVIFIAVISMLSIGFFIKRDFSTVAQVSQATVQEKYEKRTVKNVAVKNYNAVGDTYTVYDHVPQRVLAIGENINETLVALGVEDRVICAVKYGNPYYIPEPEYAVQYNKLDMKPRSILNVETVIAMRPDLIISGQSLFTEKGLRSTEFWNNRGINTYVPLNANSPKLHNHRESLDLEYEFILGLGQIFDKEAKAKEIVHEMDDIIVRAKKLGKGRPAQKVMIIEELGKNLVSYDDYKLAGDIVKRLGADVPSSPMGTISREYLLEENPEVIFVVKSGGDPDAAAQDFINMKGLQNLKAIKNKRVHGIALNYTYNSAIKTKTGIKKFAEGIYPDLKEQ